MPQRHPLDLDTLRTLVLSQDLGGLARAAEQLGRTPSAITLQLKRLQDDLGTPLFVKRGRRLVLTESGEVALAYARRILALHDELVDSVEGANLAGQICIGCPQDFADALPAVLSGFAALYPRMQVELQIEGSTALVEGVERGRIDLAVAIGHEGRADAEAVGELEVKWVASPDFSVPASGPLPLAMLGAQCIFRKRAVAALERAGVAYRIAAASHSLDGLRAALRGSLGVTARTDLVARDGLVSGATLQKLPRIGSLPVTLHRAKKPRQAAVDRMAILLSDAIRELLPANR